MKSRFPGLVPVILKPRAEPWNLPPNQQPQVNPLQLVSESTVNSLENLGLSAHTPNPAEISGPSWCVGREGAFSWEGILGRHQHPQPVPGWTGWGLERTA